MQISRCLGCFFRKPYPVYSRQIYEIKRNKESLRADFSQFSSATVQIFIITARSGTRLEFFQGLLISYNHNNWHTKQSTLEETLLSKINEKDSSGPMMNHPSPQTYHTQK